MAEERGNPTVVAGYYVGAKEKGAERAPFLEVWGLDFLEVHAATQARLTGLGNLDDGRALWTS
ncbi:hypothetical protein [Aliihoeflea sp. PC F10.4]